MVSSPHYHSPPLSFACMRAVRRPTKRLRQRGRLSFERGWRRTPRGAEEEEEEDAERAWPTPTCGKMRSMTGVGRGRGRALGPARYAGSSPLLNGCEHGEHRARGQCTSTIAIDIYHARACLNLCMQQALARGYVRTRSWISIGAIPAAGVPAAAGARAACGMLQHMHMASYRSCQ